MQLFSADAVVFFLTPKKWKNEPQNLLIIGTTSVLSSVNKTLLILYSRTWNSIIGIAIIQSLTSLAATQHKTGLAIDKWQVLPIKKEVCFKLYFWNLTRKKKKMKYKWRKLGQTDSKSLLYHHFYAISIFFCYLTALVTAYALISDDFSDHCWSNKPYEKLRNINKNTGQKEVF